MYNCGMNIDRYQHKAVTIDKAGKDSLDGLSFSGSRVGGEKQLEPIRHLKISKPNLLNTMADAGHSRLSRYHCFSEQNPEVRTLTFTQSESLSKLCIRKAKVDRQGSFLCGIPRHSSTQSEL